MGLRDGGEDVMVLRPTREQFSVPFVEFVRRVLRKHPNIPMFKVVPPEGWKPRRRPFPKLSSVEIATPIKQIVYGKGGVYRCILMEQKGLTAERFKELSEDAGHRAPESKRGKDGQDELLERSFWSSVTINPPFYGADTPQSFFDEKLDYGWNLRHLEGCILRKNGVPSIPGVTTPMTYFGMWKAFFSWHVEDADLFSINYLHFGAPKVWYCVAPSQRAKFERMAQSLYPELHRGCHAFMRHKDVLLSPQMLRTYGVEYTMAKQEPNQFIVLNTAAYHAGYNLGFNCAEAINFAMQEWIEVGRRVERCKCDVMRDGVRISMKLFGCESDSSDGGSDESEEEASDSDASDDGSGSGDDEEEEEQEGEEEEGEGEEEEEAEEGGGAAAARRSGRERKRSARISSPPPPLPRPRAAPAKRAAPGAAAAPEPKRAHSRATRTALAAAADARKQRSGRTSADARARLAAKIAAAKAAGPPARAAAAPAAAAAAPHPTDLAVASLHKAAGAAAALRASHAGRARAARRWFGDDTSGSASSSGFSSGGGGASGSGGGGAEAASGSEPSSPTAARAQPRRGGRLRGAGAAAARPPPQVIVGENGGGRFFHAAQVLSDVSARGEGRVVMEWLKESPDGLFRPSGETWEERPAALVDVAAQWVGGGGGGGWRLLTLRSAILGTQLAG